MPLSPSQTFPLMCLTQDGLALTHQEQAERLCAAGARWIQLRVKRMNEETWLQTAKDVVRRCHRSNAICIINDRVDLALAAGADGVHLGKQDLPWAEARRRLGPKKLLGGTVNNLDDADRATASGCLDYVGVGPLRFTANKEKLAPVLGLSGVRALVTALGDLPAWVIGGIVANDLPAIHATGAAGVAMSSALFLNRDVERNFDAFATAWPVQQKPVDSIL